MGEVVDLRPIAQGIGATSFSSGTEMSISLRAMSSPPYASNSAVGVRPRCRGRQARAHASEDITMPAYWVARSKINDPVEYKKYTDLVPGIIAKFGGKVLARGGRYQIMEGPAMFHRFVVIEFPTFEQGVACFTSPEYDRAATFRRNGAGEVETIMVEGGDPTR
jgi:uncharacterized protein (DUF1330 family)